MLRRNFFKCGEDSEGDEDFEFSTLEGCMDFLPIGSQGETE